MFHLVRYLKNLAPTSSSELRKSRPLRRRTQQPRIEGLEDRSLLTGVIAGYAVTQDWGSGFQGEISLTNQRSTAINDWRLEFDYGASITSIWDAQVVSHSGTHYVIASAGWNSTLAAGGKVSFGFVASPGTTIPTPINYKLNGLRLDPVTPPPLPTVPTISIVDVSVSEGNAGLRSASFNVSLSGPATSSVVVTYATADGSARAGTDYYSLSGKLTFAPGETARTVNVQIVADTLFESDETFNLSLSAATGADISRSSATGTILNDDDAPPEANDFQFKISDNWGSGFTGEITARNNTGTALNGWTLAFDYSGQIVSIWSATIISHTGNRYVIGNADWNGSVAAGAPVSFGLVGSGSTSMANFAWGAPVGDGTGGNTNPGGGSSGGTTDPGNSPSPNLPLSQVVWPAQYSAPYVDMGLYPMYDLATVARTQGVRFFTLAFITADPSNAPAWGGYSAYAVGSSEWDTQMKAQISGVRAAGGDVMVSFGGAANRELAEVITDVRQLTAAYQKVIDAYGLTHIDFDIEGAAQADRASVDRRSQAIAQLQLDAAAAGRPLEVWFTLPVLPSGLTPDGLNIIHSAVRNGVHIAGVNIMAMDYGDSAAPNPEGHMGDYAIQAGISLFHQLQGVYGAAKTDAQLWKMVGITPMIGMNDVQTEIFDQQEARELVAWANQRGIGRLSLWSLNRDKANSRGTINYVELTSSSINQAPFEFSLIFQEIEG